MGGGEKGAGQGGAGHEGQQGSQGPGGARWDALQVARPFLIKGGGAAGLHDGAADPGGVCRAGHVPRGHRDHCWRGGDPGRGG